jgi:hypothetical protein
MELTRTHGPPCLLLALPCLTLGSWAQTWENCSFFDYYTIDEKKLNRPHENRRCDVDHAENLQDAVRAKIGPGDRLSPVDQIFTPDDCTLGPFDADVLLASIGVNSTLWYVGDSVTTQSFFSTGCLLEAAGTKPRWAEDEWSPATLPQEARVQHDGFINENLHKKPIIGFVDALYRKCLLAASPALGGDVRMCQVFTSPQDLLYKYPGLLQRIAANPSDTVVMNFGVRTQTAHTAFMAGAAPDRGASH